MKTGYQELYIKGNKFAVHVCESHLGGTYAIVLQERWLSGGAYGSQSYTNTKSWYRNVSKVNKEQAINTYKLLSLELA